MKAVFSFQSAKNLKELINLRRARKKETDWGNPVAAGIRFSAVFLHLFQKKIKNYFADIKKNYIFAMSIKTNRPAGLPEQKNKVMKATVSFNGKKYIYKLDGKQIRTSTKSYAYEFVAVLTINGEFRDVMAMGNAKTCNAPISNLEITKTVIKSELAYLKGEISYKQYLYNVGFAHAFVKSAFVEMIERRGVEKCIEEREKRLAAKMNEKIEVIKIENEF